MRVLVTRVVSHSAPKYVSHEKEGFVTCQGRISAVSTGLLTVVLIVLTIEALNAAVECIVYRISPGFSEFARDAKDLGSFAVFCLFVANGGFYTYAFWQLLI
ncbi:diacylglycerol kinase [Cochlodiniinecator piscidefendens]|uniref:diacylglycerol kinase n=1 Tax=Cochlodiniinecator piscidefendens TaxID=2715756 RepID=UPI0038B28A49